MTEARMEAPRAYRAKIPIRFTHCDPAGIVFYPRYFEMFNDLVEDWFRDGLQFPFPHLINRRGWGVPTVHLEVDFVAPSTFGEELDAQLRVQTVGATSIGLEIVLSGPRNDARVRARFTLVLIDRKTYKAIPLPDDLRAKVLEFRQSE